MSLKEIVELVFATTISCLTTMALKAFFRWLKSHFEHKKK